MSMAASPAACEPVAARRAIVVMGVSGCGKSTIGRALAERLGLHFIDGDDLHLPESVARMRNGIALTDADRWPWLDRVGRSLADAQRWPAGVVIACSALKRSYRERIRATAGQLHFVFLHGDAALIRARMSQRGNHYMPTSLLDSQLGTLEPPAADETDVIRLDIAEPTGRIVDQALAALAPAALSHPQELR
jgi:carbohydrate kinase (thermoresistant glucokinase family)